LGNISGLANVKCCIKGSDGPANCLGEVPSTEPEQPLFRVALEELWVECPMQSVSRKVASSHLPQLFCLVDGVTWRVQLCGIKLEAPCLESLERSSFLQVAELAKLLNVHFFRCLTSLSEEQDALPAITLL